MGAAELRALTAQGPAVVMAAKDDMLALLDERDALLVKLDALRVVLRVNALRHGATNAEVDEVLAHIGLAPQESSA